MVSIDAIGTQVEIADQIIKGHGNYFLAVKDNQPALSEAVKDAFKYNRPISEASQMEADHGRIETRDCRILDADCIEDESVSMRWPGLKTLVEITSSVERQDGQKIVNKRYYISNEDFPKAAYFNMLSRGHWSVENGLHWHLDVTLKEDAWRSRNGVAAQYLSCFRKLALQIVKSHSDKRSIKKRLFRAAISQDYLREILASAII